MFESKAGNLWRWCGLAVAVTLLTLCVVLLSSQAVVAEGTSPQAGIQLDVNYAHDWVGVSTDPNATVVVTVAGKGTLTAQADGDGWMMSHDYNDDWSQGQPDLEPGDRITATSISEVVTVDPVGTINGNVNLATDLVAGTIQAPFGSQGLTVWCEIWNVDPGPEAIEIENVPANGGSYSCDFGGKWDIQIDSMVAVRYFEPDGDSVINVFEEPKPNMNVEKWVEGGGDVLPGGPAVFTIRLQNHGEADAHDVVLTDTLPSNTSWLADSSGFTPGFEPGVVTWYVGTVEAQAQIQFQLVLTPDTTWSGSVHNEVDVYAPYDDSGDNNHAEVDVNVSTDAGAAPDFYVDKNPDPWDPYPGDAFLWEINYGNQGPIASGPVVLTDVLVAGTQVLTWYSDQGYSLWSEESTGGEFVLKAPAIPGNWGDRILLWLEVDSGVSADSTLSNTVEITGAGDTVTDNNKAENYNAVVSDRERWNASIQKQFSWGQLVPGGELSYNMHLRNDGNRTIEVSVIDTLPEGVSLESANANTGSGQWPFPPDSEPAGQAVWDDSIGKLLPGERMNIDVRLKISKTVDSGTYMTNCVKVVIDGQVDEDPWNNEACWTDRVSAPGPNVRIRKMYDWNGDDRLRYDLWVDNIGTSDVDELLVTDIYPADVKDLEWHMGHGPEFSQKSHDAGSRTLVFELEDTLQRGETARIEMYVNLVNGGVDGQTFVNQVSAPLTGDIYPADNSTTVTSTTGPDVFAEKWVSGGRLQLGEIVTFTIAFGNQNKPPWNSDWQFDSWVTETLPSGMTFITATAPNRPDKPWAPAVISGTSYAWNWAPLWAQSRWEFELVAQIGEGLDVADVLTNTVEARGESPNDVEADYTNNVYELPLSIYRPYVYLPIVMKNH